MLKREISLIAVPAVTVGMFAGCMSVRSTGGLLEQTDPATNVTSSKLRVLLADYVTQFGDRIEQAADEILSQTSDPQIHRNALLWKSNAISACFCAASRRDPLAAYLDVWILSRQMTQFLEQPSSNSVFGPWQAQALETSRQLETPLAQIQAMLHSNTRFEERFVDGFAREHPITSLYFCRASLAAPYIEEVDVDQTDGVLGHASPLRDAGRRTISGTRQLSSHGEFLKRYSFCPMFQPLSAVMMMMVLFLNGLLSTARTTVPTQSSTAATHAR